MRNLRNVACTKRFPAFQAEFGTNPARAGTNRARKYLLAGTASRHERLRAVRREAVSPKIRILRRGDQPTRIEARIIARTQRASAIAVFAKALVADSPGYRNTTA